MVVCTYVTPCPKFEAIAMNSPLIGFLNSVFEMSVCKAVSIRLTLTILRIYRIEDSLIRMIRGRLI
jgi:hypothetical protein